MQTNTHQQQQNDDTESQTPLAHRLSSDDFSVAVEIETSRGLAMELDARHAVQLAEQLAQDTRPHIVCFTDNPGGNPHITPENLGANLLGHGADVVINVSCKDYNRNALESRLWSLSSQGFHDVLALSGDYPIAGISGQAKPVFDTDSAGLLEMIRRMNNGLSHTIPGRRNAVKSLLSTRFHPGAAVNPFKLYEGEYLTQLYKMDLKLRTGAKWLVSQIGYDARKHHELIRYLHMTHRNNKTPPVLGAVYVLSAPAARFFGRWGIPGVAVNSQLVELANKQAKSKDRGRSFFDQFAAKQIAILRGCGYKGVYLSGRLDFARIQRILTIADSFSENDWLEFAGEINFAQPNEFYLFEPGNVKGTASNELSKNYIEQKEKGPSRIKRMLSPNVPYRLGRFGKEWLFDHEAPGFKLSAWFYKQIEKNKVVSRAAHIAEQSIKVPLYGCRDCGDCSLPDIGELCPESQCVKNQRNGPCGGTKAGKCEILDKQCIYLRAYDRLKLYGEEENMLIRPVVFKDASLQGTSSWANTFAKRDHYAESDKKDKAPNP